MRGIENCRRIALMGAAAAAGSLGGCADLATVYHNRPLGAESVITTDAYQRHAFVTTGPEGQLRICAEAAPDAFSALSASLAAQGDVTNRTASVTAALAQSGTAFERTQTVNVLRESMYRTCERYLSGAIDKRMLVVQAARDQRDMVAVLAIEELGEAARNAPAGGASAPLVAAVPDKTAIDLIADLRSDEKKAKDAQAQAQTKFTTAGGPDKCKAARPADNSGAISQADWDKCNAAKTDLDASNAAVTAASTRVDQALSVSGAAAPKPADAAGAGTGKPLGDTAITAIAKAMTDITAASGVDEPLMFCIGYLSYDQPPQNAGTIDQCNKIVTQRFINDELSRGKILDVELGATTVAFSDYRAAQPGDTAKPILLSYLQDAALSATERHRRLSLASTVAIQLKLIVDPHDITQLVLSTDEDVAARLLAQLIEAETDPAGKAALGSK
jgi:hypothetical protein